MHANAISRLESHRLGYDPYSSMYSVGCWHHQYLSYSYGYPLFNFNTIHSFSFLMPHPTLIAQGKFLEDIKSSLIVDALKFHQKSKILRSNHDIHANQVVTTVERMVA